MSRDASSYCVRFSICDVDMCGFCPECFGYLQHSGRKVCYIGCMHAVRCEL